jgi:WD40 repeat protein
VKLWNVETGNCLCTLLGHESLVKGVAWGADQRHALSGDFMGQIRVWDLSDPLTAAQAPAHPSQFSALISEQVQYTNAKVLLVGESGAGKTGLSKVLPENRGGPATRQLAHGPRN